jgi:hypothetical protein
MASIFGRRKTSRERDRNHGITPTARPRLTLLTWGPALYDLRYWTEEEWAALPEGERPREHVHAPGRGRFGAVPVTALNKS